MKIFKLLAVLILPVTVIASSANAQQINSLKLWYKEPANSLAKDTPTAWKDDQEWLKALPLGNGSLGAMVFGDVLTERIQLNEKTLWNGSTQDSDNPAAYPALDSIRKLLFAGKYTEANELTDKTQICTGAGSGHANGANIPFGTYQTLGDLRMDFANKQPYSSYYRELSLNDAIVRVNYRQNNINFKREAFISYPANTLIIKLTADKKGSISFNCSLDRPERFITQAVNNQLVMSGRLNNGKGGEGMEYMARLKAKLVGGRQYFKDNKLVIENADEVILMLTAATDYLPSYPVFKGKKYKAITGSTLLKAYSTPYAVLKSAHLADYKKYFDRFSLQLTEEKDSLPTNERLARFKQKPEDKQLLQLYFQFGRYLLISSSRENNLPSNLQGIWANKLLNAWNCDYHTNINVQMNYWPVETTNLSELHTPLINYIKSLQAPGTKTAKIQYHANGWVVHTIANVWGFTSPGELPSFGLSLGCAGWLCQHLWEHYLYTKDEAYLRQVLPVMLGSAEFYTNWLVTYLQTGKLVSGPAASPENTFVTKDGVKSGISMGPSHDQEIIHQLFSNVLAAAAILNTKSQLLTKIKTAHDNMLLPKIGTDGRIMEWAQPFDETEPGHRHLSHLYALFPGNEFNAAQTPAFVKAAQKSLEFRLANGGGYTGWSGAWVSNLWARLHNGDRAMQAVNKVMANNTAYNLFDLHTPFQIDGNFGIIAGMAEMLLQSHNDAIELLPALPADWKEGQVKGICGRGGFVADIQWKDSQAAHVKVLSKMGGTCKILSVNPLAVKELNVKAQKTDRGYWLTFNSEKGKSYNLSAVR